MNTHLRQRSGWVALTALLVVIVCVAMLRAHAGARRWDQAQRIEVAGIQPGTAQLMHDLWVVRQTDGRFAVFLNRDPHCGEPTAWNELRGQFVSPHGETYTINGACIAGPCGAGSLYRVEARLEGMHLKVLPNRIISGGVRDATPWYDGIRRFFGLSKAPTE